MGATESLISRIRGCDWIPFSPDKKYSPTCQLVLRISYFPQKYFSIKINFAFRQNDICGSKQSPSVGDDNFIPHDSWSSAVIDRQRRKERRSRNEETFFSLIIIILEKADTGEGYTLFHLNRIICYELGIFIQCVGQILCNTKMSRFLRGVVLRLGWV